MKLSTIDHSQTHSIHCPFVASRSDGDLVSVNSRQENEEVKQLCTEISGGKNSRCWLGLTQPFYEWENAQYVSWSDWGPGEPTNSNSEKCTRMNADGDWSDCPCNDELYTICEQSAASYRTYTVIHLQYFINMPITTVR